MMGRSYCLGAALALLLVLAGCAAPAEAVEGGAGQAADSAPAWEELALEDSLELQYADQFAVDFYQGGYALISVADGEEYLLVPEDAAVPTGVAEDVTVLQQLLDSVYLVATSAMDLFVSLDALDAISLSGTSAVGGYLPGDLVLWTGKTGEGKTTVVSQEILSAMEAGEILYAGKYNAPDYERIFAAGCDMAVESTMIYHAPEVKEQLERLGIPVFVERSSYESSPLGRMEWLKLYGVLLGKLEEAEAAFGRAMADLAPVLSQEGTGKTVAFFYITSTGAANVRRSGDYVSRMIEMAGGTYIFPDLGEEDSALSTVNMDMETFYVGARDADVLIYNSTIDGELHTVAELLDKSPLLADFKAVETGDVWCTEQNLFQSTMGLGKMIADIHTVLTQDDPDPASLTYLHRLEG